MAGESHFHLMPVGKPEAGENARVSASSQTAPSRPPISLAELGVNETDPSGSDLSGQDLLRQLVSIRAAFRREQQEAHSRLATDRERIAAEHQRLTIRQVQTRALQKSARKSRERVRQLYSRFLKRMKETWSTQRRQIERERVRLSELHMSLIVEAERLRDMRDRMANDAEANRNRLRSEWELVHQSQRQLLADREEAEKWISCRIAELETRSRELIDGIPPIVLEKPAEVDRQTRLTHEFHGLELRIQHTRAVLDELEQRRRAIEEQGGLPPTQAATITLDGPTSPRYSYEFERFLMELQEGRQQLSRERQMLHTARQDLERRSMELTDQRAVLAEQAATLASARNQWHAAERITIDELEALTHTVRAREEAVAANERKIFAADRRRREQAYEVWQLQFKLDAWQRALTARESAIRACIDRAEREHENRRSHLQVWEHSLESLARKWAELREQERNDLRAELQESAMTRERDLSAAKELDEARSAYLAEAARLGAMELANTQADPATANNSRRVNTLRRKWERHFEQARRELDRRTAKAQAATEQAKTRLNELHQTIGMMAEQRHELLDLRTRVERDRLAELRCTDAQNREYNLETSRRHADEAEMVALRSQVHYLTEALQVMKSGLLPEDDQPETMLQPSTRTDDRSEITY